MEYGKRLCTFIAEFSTNWIISLVLRFCPSSRVLYAVLNFAIGRRMYLPATDGGVARNPTEYVCNNTGTHRILPHRLSPPIELPWPCTLTQQILIEDN